MMRWLLCITVACATLTPTPGLQAETFHDAAKRGLAALEAGTPEEAVQALRAAESAADEAEVSAEDQAANRYNLGLALLAQEDFEAASDAFSGSADETTSPDRQADAWYNDALARRGLGQRQLAQAGSGEAGPAQMEPLQQASDTYAGALQQLRKSLRLRPEDQDAKANLELFRQEKTTIDELLEELEQQQQNQPQEPEQHPEEQEPDEGSDQQSPPEQPQNPDDGSNPENGENEPEGEQPDPQEEQGAEEGQEGEQQEQQGNPDPQEGSAESGDQGDPVDAQQMTAEEAELLLDQVRQEENARRERARVILGKPQQVDKDW